MSTTGARRAADPTRRGPGALAVLAVLAPVLAVVLALLVRAEAGPTPVRAPDTEPLAASTLVCPGATGEAASSVAVGSAAPTTPAPDAAPDAAPGAAPDAAQGQVVAGPVGSAPAPLALTPGTTTAAGGDPAAVVVDGSGALAPGLVATRTDTAPLAAAACRTPLAQQWFTGVGAGAEHASVLELVNPDASPAIAEVTVLSDTGPVPVDALRGVAVPARSTSRFDLSQLAPQRGELAVQVRTTRGRLGVGVVDRQDRLDGSAPLLDRVPAQPGPRATQVLLGLTRGAGERTLVVANPGETETTAQVRVVTPRAVFAPEGVAPLRVPARSTATLDLSTVLGEASRRGGLGLVVDAESPVTAGLRQLTPDLAPLATAPVLDAGTALVLPDGRARLLLAGAGGSGTVTVTTYDAGGGELSRREVALGPDTADGAALPRGAALVRVEPAGVSVRAAVLVQDPGATVVALGRLDLQTTVPQVAPGLR